MKITYLAFAALMSAALISCNENTESEAVTEESHDHQHDASMSVDPEAIEVPQGAKVFFVNIKDGDTVASPVKIVFGIEGMEVKPAGEVVKGTGHHHIIIDGVFTPAGEVVPADEKNIHFGGGQTETELVLTSGIHTLTMQFANGIHQSFGEQMSATVNIVVK